ncbi:MAG: impB/mucB/samB family protein [Alphaproteobacteria bacterium]|nr:impB/mucB/samB family protein [Alphaproteobacteria bacterium]
MINKENNIPVSPDLKWLFLDLNSYFASVEQQDNPSLIGRPVAVVPMMTDATCAIAASYEAKAYGIKTGTKIYEAKAKCPDLVCVLARHDRYVHYHHKIVEEIARHTPINKIWSIDELSSRLPPNKRSVEAATALSHRIKKGLRDNIGPAIRASIGLAPNGFLAKVATDMEKPDGLIILHPDHLPGRLFDLSLTDLPGINTNMEHRLSRAGIRTVEQFWNISPKHARKIWGSVGGERFWYNLRGADIPEQKTKRGMIGHSRVLDPNLRPPDMARLVARRLTNKAAARLRREGFYATSFILSTRSLNGEKWAKQISVSPAQDNFMFLKALDDLWVAMMLELKPTRLKKVSVTFAGLCKTGEITPDLFDTTSQGFQDLKKKNEKLSSLIDQVNQRYGSEALHIGFTPKTQAGHVGTKIAFSRIPDIAEFQE